jgi:fructose-bisphosphate aldolase class 1
MNRSELETTGRAMVATGKGILAADESSGTTKAFACRAKFNGLAMTGAYTSKHESAGA